MTEAQFRPVKSADRTLEILEVLADSPTRCTLAHLAKVLAIPKSSLHGILRTMTRRGWVETDRTGTLFGLGMRSLLVGASYLQGDDVVARTQPLLDWLGDQLDETTQLSRLDGADVIQLAARESSRALRVPPSIGRRLPAHSTATGKALLAERTDDEVAELLPARLPAVTSNTITSRRQLFSELARIRVDGYAVDDEEGGDGVCSLAVILRTRAPAVDAVSVSVPAYRLDGGKRQRIIALLVQVHERLAQPQTVPRTATH